MAVKPLGRPAYGSIPHIRGSKPGPGDHRIPDGQTEICVSKLRDSRDSITVTEKVDGSCVAIANIDGSIIPLIRAGYHARDSHYPMHGFFADWVELHAERFAKLVRPGERVCGEWMIQASGIKYPSPRFPFIAFDMMREAQRFSVEEFHDRLFCGGIIELVMPAMLVANRPEPPESIMERLRGKMPYVPEGFVYRVERDGVLDFIAKWVRSDFVPGQYLPSVSGKPPVWNFLP